MTRIDGPGRTGAVGKTDKAKKAGSVGGSSFADLLSEEAGAVEGVTPALGTGAISTLLSIQANEQATERENRQRAIAYGDDLLDELDNLRVGLLMGNYTINQLQQISYRLEQRRLSIDDPQLLSIIDDIELRVRVEIAKYGY
ncbi:MAG TPA: flagellar assembly protein FliX [Alphaproteobacteria bacterium]